jgi:hypothetical protein
MSKTIEELESNACLYWTDELTKRASEVSSLPALLQTQDKFLSLLKCSDKSPTAWASVLSESSTLSANLFLKHLMVLSDVGGERLQRFAKDKQVLFPRGCFEFVWNGESYIHKLNAGKRSWTNKALNVEKSVLMEPKAINSDMFDVTMLLLWGSAIIDSDHLPPELIEKCVIGQLLGRTEELDAFVRQRYIAVSKITGGSTANDLGHICESYSKEFIIKNLDNNIIMEGHNILGISHNNKNLTTFDLVAFNKITTKSIAIEISFQVTTNSVIERKSGLAKSRQELLHSAGHKVAYIIDGSGNFQRKNAISSILKFSDCTVNFSDEGLLELARFINKELSESN